MKKGICILMTVALCLCFFASCGKDSGTAEPTAERTTAGSKVNVAVETTRESVSANRNETKADPDNSDGESAYVKPVDDEAVDLNKSDISTANMKFTYDEQGRITLCEYSSGNISHRVEYSYPDDGGIAVFAFAGDTMTEDTVYYPTRGFDPGLGFTAYDGYYFYGYDFSS